MTARYVIGFTLLHGIATYAVGSLAFFVMMGFYPPLFPWTWQLLMLYTVLSLPLIPAMPTVIPLPWSEVMSPVWRTPLIHVLYAVNSFCWAVGVFLILKGLGHFLRRRSRI